MRWARSPWLYLLACLALLGTVGLMRRPLLRFAVDWLDVGTPPQPCDGVMVLGGGATTRPFVAAALVKRGLAFCVLVPYMIRPAEGEEAFLPPQDEIIRELLVRRGVPRENILVIGQSITHTEAEARALKGWLDDAPGATAAVVTDGHHTRRTRWVFRRVLGDASGRVHFVSAPTDSFLPHRWWQTEAGIGSVLGEYLKLLAYFLYYGHGIYWLGGLAGLVLMIRLRHRLRERRDAGRPAPA